MKTPFLLVLAAICGAWVPVEAAPTLVSARRSFVDHTQVAVVFSEPVDPTTGSVPGNYAINTVTISGAAAGVDPSTIVLTTSDIADVANLTLTVNNVMDAAGTSTIAPNSQIAVSLRAIVPNDLRAVANGFQDDFEGETRNPLWQLIAGGGGRDTYTQAGGLLQVSVGGGDPNHLLYTASGYNDTVQEILARIRVIEWTGDTAVGGVSVGIPADTGSTDYSKGFNFMFVNPDSFGGPPEPHLVLLDDYRTFGPVVNLSWVPNTWYWLRLRQEPNTAPGQPDAFAKVWLADGDTPEPADWSITWDTANDSRHGFAGFRAGFAGVADYDVDYALIKATGLPQIVAQASAFATGPVNIVLQPQSQAAAPGDPVTFTVGADGASPFTYQWFRGASPISGATGATYTLAAATPADNGAEFTVRVGNSFGQVISDVAKLAVRADVIPPTLVSARRSFVNHTTVTVVFSKNVSVATATQAANYKINNGVNVTGAAIGSTASTVVLTASGVEEGPNSFTLTVNNVQDLAGNTIAQNSTVAIVLVPLVPAEVGTVVSGFQDDFEGSTRNPKWQAIGPDTYQQGGGMLRISAGGGDPNHLVYADDTAKGTVQEILALVRMDNFTAQEHALGGLALGVPPDSLTHDPKGGINVNFVNPGAFGGSAKPHFVFLSDYRGFGPEVDGEWTTNKWYWIRLRQDPNAGGGTADAFAKVWPADGDTPEPADWQTAWDYPDIRNGFAGFRAGIKSAADLIADWNVDYVLVKAAGLPSISASPRAFQSGPVTITQNPLRVRVGAGQQAVTFMVGVEGAGPFSFQWLKNDVPIDGATGPAHTITSPVIGDNGLYTVKVNNAFSEATSAAAELIVDVDNGAPPALVSARRIYSDHSKVAVVFSEPVNVASAIEPANYSIDNAIVVSGAALADDNTVILTTSPLANLPVHQLTVNGVRDLFGNAIAANSRVTIGTMPLVPNDVGTTIAAHQDDFDGSTRDARWVVAVGPDVYVQADGFLNVNPGSGDPNHLLFDDTYDNSTQEILARIEILTSTGENPLGVAAGVPNTSGETDYSKGMNLLFLNPSAFGGPAVPHLRFLDDYRAFGAVLDYQWVKNRWYWLRLRISPDAGPNGEDAFGKVWPADGDTPEPVDWQQMYESTPALRPGLAGFRATFENRPGTYRVDWVLIKADGLPNITPQPKVFLPDPVPPTLVSAQRAFTDHGKVKVVFSEPLDAASASLVSNYAIDNGVIVSSVALGTDPKMVTLATSFIGNSGTYSLTVNGVQDIAGNAIAANSKLPLNLAPALPAEFGSAVNGFQDDFAGSARDPKWTPIGPDVYAQSGGVLNVHAGGGDPNHLVYNEPSYEGTDTEILARIKVVQFTSHEHAFGGVAVGVPLNSLELTVKGGMNLDIVNPSAFGGPNQPHLFLLNDYTGFGPSVNFLWNPGTWYWLRLKHTQVSDAQATSYAKAWPADGDVAEPAAWQNTWDTPNPRSGFAGIRAGIQSAAELIGDFQVDYVLIKAAGLPTITPAAGAFGLDTSPPTLVSARRLFVDPTSVRLAFSEPILAASGTQTGNYLINNGVVVSAVQLGADGQSVLLTTAAPIPLAGTHQLVVNGVQDGSGNLIAPNSAITVDKAVMLPLDMATTVHGFQDDFDGPARDSKWTPIGPDVYEQSGGVLNVHAGGGDPNHLVYNDPSYQGADTEILARIQIVQVTAHEHAFGGVAVGVPLNSLELAVKGGMNLNLVNPGAFGGSSQRHARLLNDYTGFGPEVPNFEWSAAQWYWLRLKHAKVSDTQAATSAKVWPADGDTAEPGDWQVTWDTANPRSGFAGIRAGIKSAAELIGDFQLDYVLIKAAGLPDINPSAQAFTGQPAAVQLGVTLSGANVVISWPAAAIDFALQESGDLVTWTAVNQPPVSEGGLNTVTVPLGSSHKFYRLKKSLL